MQRILILLCQMFNLLEYSDNYSMASGSLRDYYRDEHCVKCSNFT